MKAMEIREGAWVERILQFGSAGQILAVNRLSNGQTEITLCFGNARLWHCSKSHLLKYYKLVK